MNFGIGKQKDIYLSTTDVENLFINEYMTGAPGDYVKVYLLGLLYAQTRTELSLDSMAKTLNMANFEVHDAWDYWARLGLVRKIFGETNSLLNYDVEFISIRDKMYSMANEEKTPITKVATIQSESRVDINQREKKARPFKRENRQELQELFSYVEVLLGRPLSPQEMNEIASWNREDKIECEIIKVAYDYCYNINKKNVNYVAKVVKDWKNRGFATGDEAKDYVQQLELNQERYRTVFRSLGFYRNPTEAERSEMDRWFDEMKFTMERVLEACSQTTSIPNPNIKYVGKILENWHDQGKIGEGGSTEPVVSRSVLNKYLEAIRLKADSDARKKKDQIYHMLPELAAIDSAIKKESRSLSGGYGLGFDRNRIIELKQKMDNLRVERENILRKNNLSIDYTDIKYSCDKCKDTCFTEDGLPCDCTKQRMREADLWQKGKLEI